MLWDSPLAKFITFRVTEDTLSKLRGFAKKDGVDVSSLVRSIIEDYLESKGMHDYSLRLLDEAAGKMRESRKLEKGVRIKGS